MKTPLEAFREQIAALRYMRDLTGLDCEPIGLRDEESNLAAFHSAIEQLRAFRKVSDDRDGGSDLGASQLERGDPGAEIRFAHHLECLRRLRQLQVAEE